MTTTLPASPPAATRLLVDAGVGVAWDDVEDSEVDPLDEVAADGVE
ncbi:MAG: hypothetical protein M3Y35_08615 [Actinomycetota bacterium]|nr:hypothetical protein [Actinomycetota bacterium]